MATTNMTVRIDEELKNQVEMLLEDMGLNMTTAITVFAKAIVRQGKIPFEIAADPFWSEQHQEYLKETIAYLNAGRDIVEKTMDELLRMENE